MTINEYLGTLLSHQILKQEELDMLDGHRIEVEGFLRDKFGEEPVIKFAGSKAKGTMISESYDLDIVCYFPYTSEKTLKELHDEVQEVLSKQYNIIPKASAIRITGLKDGPSDNTDYHIDVVPGRFVDESQQDAFLHVVYGEKERMQTNIKTHIKYISESECRELIKLLKLWAHRNNLLFKTFVLELFVVRTMEGFEDKNNLQKSFDKLLNDLAVEFEIMRLVDPANSNNIVTDTMTDSEKMNVAQQARIDLEKIHESEELGDWQTIFKDQSAKSTPPTFHIVNPPKPWCPV